MKHVKLRTILTSTSTRRISTLKISQYVENSRLTHGRRKEGERYGSDTGNRTLCPYPAWLIALPKGKDLNRVSINYVNTHRLTTSRPPMSGCKRTLARKNCSSFRRESRKAGRKRAKADFGGRAGIQGIRCDWTKSVVLYS